MTTHKPRLLDELAAVVERTGATAAEVAAAAADMEAWEAQRLAGAEDALRRVEEGADCRPLEDLEPKLRARLEERIAAAHR